MSSSLQPTWVVIPTYNERDTLTRLLPDLLDRVECTILGVDDASEDGTASLWDAWRSRCPDRVEVIHRSGKLGLGTAYLSAFEYCLDRGVAEWIVQMDTDGSHRVEDLVHMLAEAPSTDLVIGSRYVPGASTPGWSSRRRAVSKGGSWYSRQVLGCPVRDLTGGFKVWRASFLRRMPLDQITATGYGFQIAMNAWAWTVGGRIQEVPICFPERQAGTSKMSSGIVWEAVGLVWQVRAQCRMWQLTEHQDSEDEDTGRALQ